MYIPAAFEEKNSPVLHAFMRQHSFAALVTAAPQLDASHLPFILHPHAGPLGTLRSHLARANPQWQSFADDAEVLILFALIRAASNREVVKSLRLDDLTTR